MSLESILQTIMYGTFRCDYCGDVHPRKQYIWRIKDYPGKEFGSKKCLMKYVRQKKREKKLDY